MSEEEIEKTAIAMWRNSQHQAGEFFEIMIAKLGPAAASHAMHLWWVYKAYVGKPPTVETIEAWWQKACAALPKPAPALPSPANFFAAMGATLPPELTAAFQLQVATTRFHALDLEAVEPLALRELLGTVGRWIYCEAMRMLHRESTLDLPSSDEPLDPLDRFIIAAFVAGTRHLVASPIHELLANAREVMASGSLDARLTLVGALLNLLVDMATVPVPEDGEGEVA